MKKHLFNRLLSLVLAAVMVLGLFPAVSAAPTGLHWEKTDVDVSWDRSDRLVPEEIHGMDAHKPTDLVRVSIVLEEEPTLKTGYSTQGIGTNTDARAYDLNLQKVQEDLAERISAQALGGRELDVVWNLTLVGNIISANVPYGKLDAVRAVDGIRDVVIENSYEVQTAAQGSPDMHSAAGMVGSPAVWQNGLTGAGTRIAIVDTGTDTDHQSFDNGAYLHALEQNAAAKGMSYEDYVASLDLLDADEIAGVLKNLNASERIGEAATKFYISEKLPFGANYVDRSLVVDHDHDRQGSHGSHVGGIAAANRFIPKDGSYKDARQSVQMCGVAPDAQIITMKVFGNGDGPYESDYFAAIEDAIWLGCDSVNLSLGSANPGNSHNTMFADMLDFMATTDTVVVMSAGNSGHWAENTNAGYLYSDGVSFQTDGEPGSYTNTLTVASVDHVGSGENTDYYTMSTFSSWGVPGSLELKPEITAPGGSILSVNGTDPSGSAYETQSGTSMAAPQVAGMAALVAEYIRVNKLDGQSDMSVRQLAQSLLMSTAVPLRELDSGGEYYSILKQGAGLARVDLATTAESYVTVADQPDGKVKAEVGDDADRTGVYEFSFTIHSLGGKDMTYELSADLFTQQVFDGGEGNGVMYLDTWTQGLGAEAVFCVDGVSLENAAEDFDCDLNGDGATTAADADYLLEYLLGNVSALKADADVSGDGKVTSYDAHVLLTRLSGKYSVVIPAGDSVTIDVALKLTEQTTAYLDTHYPSGAYVEGFVFAEPVSEGVVHSIPVLGYYGSWTEPSMYDVGSYLENESGSEIRDPYLYAVNGDRFNYVTVDYGDGKEYIFGGNPFVAEDEYLPERNAFNNQNGAMLQSLRFTQIRNAAASRLLVENADTGAVYVCEDMGPISGAYYHVNMGAWQQTQNRWALGLGFHGIKEGSRVNVSLLSAPEYYCTYDADGRVTADWDALDEGACLTTSFTIDNTAPEIKNVELGRSNDLIITAQDNEYIAAVALVNAADTNVLTSAPANQTARGVEITCSLDLSFIYGREFLVAVYDYARNRSVYKVTLELNGDRPYFTAIDRNVTNPDDFPSYVGLDESKEQTYLWLSDVTDRSQPCAVEYVEGAVFEVTDDHKLYVGYDDDLAGIRCLSDLDPTGELEIKSFADLAYNRANGKLYGLYYSNSNDLKLPYLCTIDLYNGQLSVLGEMPIDAGSMTIDGEGNFYSVTYGSGELHTYTADVIDTGKTICVDKLDGYETAKMCAMAWDHNTDELYWMINTDSGSALIRIDPVTAKTEQVSTYGFTAGGLYIAYATDSDLFAPGNTVTSVRMEDSASTMVGNTVKLNALLLPWNVSDKTVTWSTSNAEVAAVNADGVVKGISAGTAVITATSNLDKTKSASCTVTIISLDKSLNAVVWDEDGKVWWSEFTAGMLPAYERLSAVTSNLPVNATMMADGTLYAAALDTSSGLSDLYTVDPKTFEMNKVGGSDSVGYLDMAYAPSLGCGLGVYFGYIVLIDLETGDYEGAWAWSNGMTSELVGITYYGSEYNSSYGVYMDYFLILDREGNVYLDAFMDTGSKMGYINGPEEGAVKTIGDPVDYTYFQGFHYDGEYVYWSRFSEADNIVELRAWDCDGTDEVYSLGYFPVGVWPVAGLYTDAQLAGNKTLVDETMSDASVKPAELMTAIPGAELSGTVKGGLNAVSNAAPVIKPLGDGIVKDEGSVEVTFTVPDGEATNGIVTVEFDPNALELVGIKGTTMAFAWKLVDDGKAQFAFANSNALECDKLVALLEFSSLTEGKTNIYTSFGEWNNGTASFGESITINVPAYNPFTDVPAGSFYYEPVLWAVKKGITNGATATTFNPNGQLQRAQFVTMLWRAAGSPEPSTTANPFVDVKKTDFFYKAVLWAVENKITNGISANEFGAYRVTNRAQAVTFLWRYLGEPKATATNSFSDVVAGQWYEAPINWAVGAGVTNGISATEFGIDGNCNRAQAVTFLHRALEK